MAEAAGPLPAANNASVVFDDGEDSDRVNHIGRAPGANHRFTQAAGLRCCPRSHRDVCERVVTPGKAGGPVAAGPRFDGR